MFSFSGSLGRQYNGQWISANTFVITISSTANAIIPIINYTTVTPAGFIPILSSDETSTASYTTSPVLSGDFGIPPFPNPWNDGGTGVIYYNGGNVGIGTVNPDQSLILDVEGNIGAHMYCDEDGQNCKNMDELSTITDWVNGISKIIFYNAENIGIGGTPQVDLHIASNHIPIDNYPPTSRDDYWKTKDYDMLYLSRSSVSNIGPSIFMKGYGNDGNSYSARIVLERNGHAGGELVFFTSKDGTWNQEEAMRITRNGNVGIGTTSPSQKLDVNGNGIANSWLTHANQKWKQDITPLDGTLDKITQIQGVTYSWRVDEFPDMSFDETTTQIGFIAEELEMIYPELVYTNENGDKSIDYSKLTPILLEAIKEQQDRFDEKFTEQQDTINTQQDILEQLKTVICPEHPELSACQ